MADAELLSVGRLARRTGLTAKALRHYDRIGLLRPAYVDDAGYRWYAAEQVAIARRIAILRDVDLPLDEVRRCLESDEGTSAAVLEQHRRRLDARLTRLQRQAHLVHHLSHDGLESRMTATTDDTDDERRLGKALFNATWTLLEKEDRTQEDDDTMLHMAHASRHHWGASKPPAANIARGEWQCSRVYAVLGRPEPCLHHAQRVLDICQANGIGDFDLAFAYEALAAAEDISTDEDRELLLGDLETIPGQPRFW